MSALLFVPLFFSLLPASSAAPDVTPAPPAAATPRPKPEKPPLDFTGVWELDEKASRNVSPVLAGAVLNVRQTGNQIWISPMDPAKSRILSESIVADGRPYEKTLGTKGKGILTVSWGKDRKSLWLEVLAGPEDDPRRIVQRSVWKLSADRRTWIRQSVSIQDGQTSESMLVLHRRQTPPRGATPKPAAGGGPKS